MTSGITACSPVERTALEAARHAAGLSRERLGALAGVSAGTVYAIEVEGVNATRATRTVLALALGCSAGDIFPINEQRPAGNGPLPKTTDAGRRDDEL